MIHLADVKKRKPSVISFIKDRYDDHKTRMVDLHREWALTLAWTRGHQNVDFDPASKKWRKQTRNPWQTRLISNLMLPIVRSKVSRLSVVKPIWDVIPATPDPEDIEIARTATKILQDAWQRHDMSKKLIRLLFWQSTTGNAFAKVGWDADIGDDVEVDTRSVHEQLLAQYAEQLGIVQAPDTVTVKSGDCFIDVVPPFNMAVDPLAATFEDTEWCIETQIRSLDWIIQKFGNKYKDTLAETQDLETLVYPYIYIDDNEKINRRGIITQELSVKKGGTFKEGLYAFIANDQVLVGPKDLPFNHGQLPYSHFLEIYDPVSMWGGCVATQVRPNQARYNKVQSGIVDHMNLVGKVQWLIPAASGIQEITNRPGENIRYRGAVPPTQNQPRNLPAYIENSLERTRRDMQDTSSYHNVSQAQSEPGLRSGRAIIALQDADDSVEGPIFLWFDESLIRTGNLLIQTINQYVSEDRLLKTRGDFNELETLTYTGQMLKGTNEGNYFDVRVKTYGRQLLSRAGREQQVLRFIELGILNPQVHQQLILEMIGSADANMIFDADAVDRSRQYNEITKIIQPPQPGQVPITVLMGENHQVHMDTIKKFFAGSKRDKLNSQQLALIQQHYDEHLRMQALEYMRQQELIQGAANVPQATGSRSTGRTGGGQGGGGQGGGGSETQDRIAAGRGQ